MIRKNRYRCAGLTMVLALFAGWVVAQDLDENGLLVAEEMVIEEALTGELATEKEIEVEEPIEEVAEEPALDLDLEDLMLEEEPVAGEEAVDTTDEATVETVADELLGEEAPSVEEPVDEELVFEEPVLEEAPIEEKGAPVAGVEELAEEVLGAEGVLEEIAEEPDEEVVEELPVIEEPAEFAAELPEEAAAEEPVEDILGDLVEEIIEEPAEEAVEEIAEELVEEVVEEIVEEPAVEMVEEAVEELLVVEEPVAEVGIEEPFAVQKPAWPPAAALRPPPPATLEPLPPSVSFMLEAEALKRKAYQRHAAETLTAAEKALKARRYQRARTLFENTTATLEQIGRRPEDEAMRERARRGLAETLYKWALVLKRQNDLEAAVQMARSASLAGHARAPRLVGEIEKMREQPPPAPPPREVARWDQPEFKTAEEDIAKRLKTGRQYYMTGEYDKAEVTFEGILKRDPYNTEAVRMLEKTSRQMHDIASMTLDATRQNMLAKLRQTWNPRDYAIDEEQLRGRMGPARPRRDTTQSERIKILKKMESIIIPEIDFRLANIHDVVKFLQDASREFDETEEDPDRKGVNIILNLQSDQAVVGAVPDLPEDPFAEPVAGGGGAAGGVPLTFSARHISLLDALKIVTRVGNLKFRIEGTVVMVVPWDAAEGEIIVRMYDVLPSVEERLTEFQVQLGGGLGGSRDVGDFRALETAPLAGGGADWKAVFKQMGVKWPQGSEIKYVSAMGKLVVANTADNLTTFEQILAELNVVPSQIEIEARFVEVSQTDLDSLGVEWLLTDDWEIAQRTGQQGTPLSGRQRIVARENATSGGFTTGNRFLREGGLGGLSVADDVLTIAGVLTNPEITAVLHALEQRGSTDLLSAPKVLTQSGVEATIKVVTEYVYPSDYEIRTEATAAGTSTGTGTAGGGGVRGFVQPAGWEMREVGVLLTVLPEVSPEGQMINLTMTPEVVSEPVWKDYGLTYTDENSNELHLTMEQPFFFTRTVSTSISIYNGATVVMGGMITEIRNEVNDQVPFLGSIPLLGRLFRSSYERSEKRNLLIFVTARLVDPAGHPLKRT